MAELRLWLSFAFLSLFLSLLLFASLIEAFAFASQEFALHRTGSTWPRLAFLALGGKDLTHVEVMRSMNRKAGSSPRIYFERSSAIVVVYENWPCALHRPLLPVSCRRCFNITMIDRSVLSTHVCRRPHASSERAPLFCEKAQVKHVTLPTLGKKFTILCYE